MSNKNDTVRGHVWNSNDWNGVKKLLIEQEIIKDYNKSNNDLRMIVKKNLMNIQKENRRIYNKKCNQY